MDINALNQALVVENGVFSLKSDTLPDCTITELLDSYNNGTSIMIENASKKADIDSVIITGNAAFLNTSGLPVYAVFTLDPNGNPVVSIRFTMIDAKLGMKSWTMAQSFPNLPPFSNFTLPSSDQTDNLLSKLPYNNAFFVLTTTLGKDSITGVPLLAGLNFIAELNPKSLLSLFATQLNKESYYMYGLITMPTVGNSIPSLPIMSRPWESFSWKIPGILLKLSLDITVKVGPLIIDQMELQMYSPLDANWLSTNPSYTPDFAIIAKMSIPSANIAAAITLDLNSNDVSLYSALSGISLDNLDQLIDLTQGQEGDLLQSLPQSVQSSLSQLGGLSLTEIGLSFYGDVESISVDWVYVVVGLPNVQWTVIDQLTIDSVLAKFVIQQPFDSSNRKVSASLDGKLELAGAVFNLFTQVPNFGIRASLEQPGLLQLSQLLTNYLPEMKIPADLHINEMDLYIEPGQFYSFMAAMSDEPAWILDIGPNGLAIESLSLFVSKQTGSSASGNLSGAIQLDENVTVAAEFDLLGAFCIRAALPDSKLSDLIARFDQLGLRLPSGFDLEFAESYLLLSDNEGTLNLTIATDLSNVGLVAFTVQKQKDQTGAAVGISLNTTQLSDISGLSALKAFDELIGLQKLMFVASSLDQTGFVFPELSNFQAPALSGKNIQLPAQANGLVEGLNLYAQLSATRSQSLQALLHYLNIELDGSTGITISVSLPDPAAASKFYLSAEYKINRLTTFVGEAGLAMTDDMPTAFLIGDVKTVLQGEPVEFDLKSAVLANGIMLSGTMKGTADITFSNIAVQLSNVAILIGLDWEGIPSLGFASTLNINGWDTSIALFFDSTDPSRTMFAGSVSDISLKDAALALAGQVTLPGALDDVLTSINLKSIYLFNMPSSIAEALDGRDLSTVSNVFKQYGATTFPNNSNSVMLIIDKPGSLWHITDMTTMTHYRLSLQNEQIEVVMEPQIYCVPEDTSIGDLTFKKGVHLEAQLDFLLLQAKVQIIINKSNGISANVDIDPIMFGDSGFFSITSADGSGGPMLSLATFNQPDEPDPERQAPHLLVSGKLELLGQDVASVNFSASKNALTFQIADQLTPVLHVKLEGSIDSASVSTQGDLIVGMDHDLDFGPLGQLSFTDNVTGSLTVSYCNQVASATFEGSFTFLGYNCSIPPITLSTNGLGDIADILLDQVKDIVQKLLVDADCWLNWVKTGVIVGAGQTAAEVGEVLQNVYQLSPVNIAQKTKQILNYNIDEVTSALKAIGENANAVIQTLSSVGYAADDITNAIKVIFTNVHADTSLGHIDEAPHVDTPGVHADTPSTHVDGAIHTDVGGDHVDKGSSWHHIDTGTPHLDTNPHGDTGNLHVDTNPHLDTTEHTDTGTHVDINT